MVCEKGVYFVFVILVQCCCFDENGWIEYIFGEYFDVMKVLVKEFDVFVIDLQVKIKEFYEVYGLEELKRLFVWFQLNEYLNYLDGIEDNMYFLEEGVMEVVKFVVEGIEEFGFLLKDYFVSWEGKEYV